MSEVVGFKEELIKSQKDIMIEHFKKIIDEIFDDLEFRVQEAVLKSKKNYKNT